MTTTTPAGFLFELDYAEGFLLALEADKAAKANREAAAALAANPEDAARFAGAVRNFEYLAELYAALAGRLRSTIGTTYTPEEA
jgi:hypothetical protein